MEQVKGRTVNRKEVAKLPSEKNYGWCNRRRPARLIHALTGLAGWFSVVTLRRMKRSYFMQKPARTAATGLTSGSASRNQQ